MFRHPGTGSHLILRSRASGVSKDEAEIVASWFGTAPSRLLTMRVGAQCASGSGRICTLNTLG